MSGYLIDTSAISLLSDDRASPEFADWLMRQQRQQSFAVQPRRGHNGQLAYILIAATAQTHNLTVVTANIRDIEALEVASVAPF